MSARLLTAAVLLMAACSFVACGPTPTKTNGTLLAVQTPSGSLQTDGTSVNLHWTALDNSQKPGTGNLTLTANTGEFANGTNTQTVALAADGTASVDYSCNVAIHPSCVGQAEVNAAWNGVRTLLFVPLVGAPDAGH